MVESICCSYCFVSTFGIFNLFDSEHRDECVGFTTMCLFNFCLCTTFFTRNPLFKCNTLFESTLDLDHWRRVIRGFSSNSFRFM